MNSRGNPLFSLFEGRCGHRWVGASSGSYACPVCGDYDGDHHLVRMDDITMQFDGWERRSKEAAQ